MFFAGILFFVLLLVSEGISTYLYYERSGGRLKLCYERSDGTEFSASMCGTINNAVDSAYSSATASHLLTYFVIFTVFVLLASRLDKIENRLKEVEGKNV
jgi:hypothetical protein